MVDPSDLPFSSIVERYGEDPPAAVLTTAQREYIFGQRELSGAKERATKSRIRQRIRAALLDFLILTRTCPDEEIEKIRPESGEKALASEALAAMLYLLQPENGAVAEHFIEEGDPSEVDARASWTESDVSRGIKNAIKHRENVDADVETSITVDRGVDLEELAGSDLAELSREQLDDLLVTGTISREDYAKAIEQQIEGG